MPKPKAKGKKTQGKNLWRPEGKELLEQMRRIKHVCRDVTENIRKTISKDRELRCNVKCARGGVTKTVGSNSYARGDGALHARSPDVFRRYNDARENNTCAKMQ